MLNPLNGGLAPALLASILLHALAIFGPYLGKQTSWMEARLPGTGPETYPPLTARLLLSRDKDSRSIPLLNQAAEPEREASRQADESRRGASLAPPAERPATSLPEEPMDGRNILPIPGPVYYTSDQLTKRPFALAIGQLDPPETRPFIASGSLIIKLWISPQGKIENVVLESSELPAVFSTASLNAFARAIFSPGERNGRRVRTLVRIEVTYDDPRISSTPRFQALP